MISSVISWYSPVVVANLKVFKHLSISPCHIPFLPSPCPGSNIDLSTPPSAPATRMRRKGSGDGTSPPTNPTGLGRSKGHYIVLPDNQLGLENDSQETVPGEVLPKDTPQVEPPKKAATAAKTRAKPKGVATPQRKLAKKSSVVEATGESKPATKAAAPPKKGKSPKKNNKGTLPGGKTGKIQQSKATEKNTGQKSGKETEVESTTSTKGKQRKASKTNKTDGDSLEPKHVNPGGPSSGSGMKRKPAQDSGAKQDDPKKPKHDDGKNTAATTPATDPEAVVSALKRASAIEQEDKEAKRKAYKARKQRFYNSLTSMRLKNYKPKPYLLDQQI